MSIDLPLSATPRVSVIIPSSTRHDLLRACLQSLARFGPKTIPYETIVVLNQATTEAETQLRGAASGIQVVSSPVNLGLAGAGNLGRARARGELLILLHDDTEIEPGWMEALVETADVHPEAGAIGGKVLFPDGRLQFAGAILWQNGICSEPWAGKAPPPTAFDRLRAVDFCGTSSLLVRTTLWDFIGGLDEQFYPVYYVDVDLAMAMRKLGFVVLYQPNSRIRHHLAASSDPSFRDFLLHRNRFCLLKKWDATLENHEPYENSPAAIERALARAEVFADHCRRMGNSTKGYAVRPTTFSATEQNSRCVEKSRAVQKAYVAYRRRRLMRTMLITKPRQYCRELFRAVARRER